MGRLIILEYVSLDGVVQAPGHAAEDRAGGFTHGGWTGPYMQAHGRYMAEALNVMGPLLLGRLTYDIWASYWPTVTDPSDEIARMLNAAPKYVASRTLETGMWPDTTVIRDVGPEVACLKDHERKAIVFMGSSELAQTLISERLVDEYRLMIHPVVLGEGKRLFRPGSPPAAMQLVDATSGAEGLITATYSANTN